MPFKRITSGKNKGKYRSPSGRIYTARQVRAYYATEGWQREPRKTARKRSTRRKKKRKKRK